MSREEQGLTGLPTFDSGFTTPEMTLIWSADATMRGILDFEAELALSLADADLAPLEEAEQVASACEAPLGDAVSLLATTWEAGTPLLAIIDILRGRIPDEPAAHWLHHGATSQDAIDTGRVIQSREALRLLESQIMGVASLAAGLVDRYRDQPHMGRTFLQDSRPITFGWRAAGWLSPLLDAVEELREQRSGLPVQLGGPDGHMGSYGEAGTAVRSALASRLGLRPPAVSWHTDRSPVWALARSVESAALWLAKIAVDIALLAQTSIAEVEVRPGLSSSMPAKRNPIDAIHTVAAASACSGFATMVIGGRHELDRGLGGWHVEWLALPMLFHTSSAAASALHVSLESLEVDVEAMAGHVGGMEPDHPDPAQIDAVLTRYAELSGRL